MAHGYRLTTEKQVRKEFWETFPNLPRKKITNYAGTGTMHCTDTRSAFADFVDMLSKDGAISHELAHHVTLD
jgi:hypothetical protein